MDNSLERQTDSECTQELGSTGHALGVYASYFKSLYLVGEDFNNLRLRFLLSRHWEKDVHACSFFGDNPKKFC